MYNLILNNLVWSSIIAVIWYVLLAAGLWKMFDKAGEAGWKALIPFYNLYILFKISWQPSMFWALAACSLGGVLLYGMGYNNASMMLIYISYALTLIAAIIKAVLAYNISLAYGHGLGWFIGLYFFDAIFIMILGFGASEYAGNRYEHHGKTAFSF